MITTYIDKIVEKQIICKLKQIEKEENVVIIYACESGSRAWGFPSNDSDYDVRFIYVRKIESYLSIILEPEIIKRPISDDIDLVGWDLRKALILMEKSNPSLLEWLVSPIVYKNKSDLINLIIAERQIVYSSKACLGHYLGMANNVYNELFLKQNNIVPIKKYFYILRNIFACIWVIESCDNCPPPIEFESLMKFSLKNEQIKNVIYSLIAKKKDTSEIKKEKVNADLLAFITSKLEEVKQKFEKFEYNKKPTNISELDYIFQHVVQVCDQLKS